jgi:predicted O-methyltransferase YrrM
MDRAIQAWFNFRGGRNNLPWRARRSSREQLAALFRAQGFRVGVEVGTQRGLFAKVLCQANPELHLTCVDPWAAYGTHPQAEQDGFYQTTVDRLAGESVTLVRQRSLDAVRAVEDASLDFVFVDGAHDFDNAVADLVAWAPKVKRGGLVAVHDYDIIDVREAVDAYARCHHIDPWYLTSDRCPTAFWVQR